MSTTPPNILSLAAARDKVKLASNVSWLLLLDLIVNGEHLRLARNVDAITFDAGDGLGAQTYEAFNFQISFQDTGSEVPKFQITASNVGRILQAMIEQYGGLAGATVNLYAFTTAREIAEADLSLSFQVQDVQCTAETVTIQVGLPSPLRTYFPKMLYRANYCMWQYKSKQCGYTGTLPTCALTYDGTNGCQAHNNGQRFGAFPSIGTNGGAIAAQI